MDWQIIIGPILNLLLAKCFGQTSSGDPKEYLKSRYNSASKTFDEPLVKSTMQQVRRSIVRAKRSRPKHERRMCPNYTQAEIRDMAVAKLTAAMRAPDAVVMGVMAQASLLDDGGDD
jgi:hypothetical protein